MINEEGYLVISEINALRNEIYGPSDNHSYTLFGSNGLKLFPEISSAKSIVDKLTGDNIHISKVKICVAENEADLENIIAPFVLLVGSFREASGGFYLVGPYVEGSVRTFDSCAYLTENGLACFGDHQRALYSRGEAARQSQCVVPIASFDLKKV